MPNVKSALRPTRRVSARTAPGQGRRRRVSVAVAVQFSCSRLCRSRGPPPGKFSGPLTGRAFAHFLTDESSPRRMKTTRRTSTAIVLGGAGVDRHRIGVRPIHVLERHRAIGATIRPVACTCEGGPGPATQAAVLSPDAQRRWRPGFRLLSVSSRNRLDAFAIGSYDSVHAESPSPSFDHQRVREGVAARESAGGQTVVIVGLGRGGRIRTSNRGCIRAML